ncbi:putative RNA polymerase II subunit B1 CTD phosphatase rpap2 [Archocentrus centrarchus]|uniref:putative RNA polymerase II subunit B1 CTD phosphatase rpap2 n=1 Tax=Archocentrus centrarchus TaxID=63155 RepID=UPI0011E9F197|nr:putative RNA polymerase II subunit B1 CTD phosphatase RPAP2 [Archocentrus centrarchus]
METEERRRSRGSKRASNKGGKRVKALTAEEEARRREELKEKLREKLELEGRALKVVERLLDDSVAEDFLADCAKMITPANYRDAVEERCIAKLCGYPICPNKLGHIPTQQYKISTKTNKVYDITERKCFCSNFCYKASKALELQIPKTPLWLRQHESPPEIKLLKQGDGGSSGEEVMLSQRRLKEEDIGNPLAAQHEDLCGSQELPAGGSHSDISDGEQEQDFVSSMVPKQQRPRVHWGDLPKRSDEDEKGQQRMSERRKKNTREGHEEKTEHCQSQNTEEQKSMREDEEGKESLVCKTEVRTDVEKPKELQSTHTDQAVPHERELSEVLDVEETTAKMSLCSLSEAVTHSTPHSNLPAESKHLPASALNGTNRNSHDQPGLNITQVGMSKRGAAGLRDLLKNCAEAKPESVRLNLLECLKKTLKEWCTNETLRFLYGSDHSLRSPYAEVSEEEGKEEVEEEELDEDDLEDEVTVDSAAEQKRPLAAAPDYEKLRRETQQLELRVREFYKGTWILPEEEEGLNGNQVTVQESIKDPVLPLIDSQAQHLIQKRITVEKLSSCLRNIVGPLHLNMSDISTDLNNLVRTFRFTNKNIIHKTPEWTLIAVVLLHLLSEVSQLVREALETSASMEYLSTLMMELSLQEQDLLSLVRLFKSPAH